MYNRRSLQISVLLAVLLHAVFLWVSVKVTVPGFFAPSERKPRLFHVKTIKKEIPRQAVKERKIISSKPLKFESPAFTDVAGREVEREEKKMKKENLVKPDEQPSRPMDLPSLEAVQDHLMDEGSGEAAVMEGALRLTRRELIDDQDLPDADRLVSPEDFMTRGQVPENFYEKMPGFTPSIRKQDEASVALKKDKPAVPPMDITYKPAIEAKERASQLDEALVFELSRYTDPEDGYNYYKIDIKVVREDRDLPTLPKEIIFLIDSSFSIKEERFDEFKAGLNYCLTNLNRDDVFNIIAFKEKLIKFWPFAIEVNQDIIWKALNFVDNLTVGSKTDTYTALYESIHTEKHRRSPAYIILLSDGRPTAGVTDSRKIISEITKLNRGRVSIFGFSGGLYINRYLLDFISYNNRGWTEYASRTRYIAEQLSAMYDKIKDPILTNVRFHVSGLDDRDIFPKLLPDFFRNATFTIYGRYKDEDKFTLEVLADAADGTHEYLVNGSLSEAVDGGEDIARNWAFNKIYYLISLLDSTQDPDAAIAEIKALYKKFNIRTPYLKRLRK